MMSCLQKNSKASFEKATEIYEKDCDDFLRNSSKIAHPYAYLAHKMGQTAEGHEVVQNVHAKSVLNTGLSIFYLTKLDRIDKAIQLLEKTVKLAQKEDGPFMKKGQKMLFSIETVKNLSLAVENSKDKFVQIRLAKVFRQLDSVAAISEQSIESMITAPIDTTKSMKYKREKNRLVRQRTAESYSDAIHGISKEEIQHQKDLQNENGLL